MKRKKIRAFSEQIYNLRELQLSAYELYARRHGLTVKEFFVLHILWFSKNGCRQSEICERLAATKQTVSAIMKKFLAAGLLTINTSESDRRNKVIHLSDKGIAYAESIILPAMEAETDALDELSGKEIMELTRLTSIYSKKLKDRLTVSSDRKAACDSSD